MIDYTSRDYTSLRAQLLAKKAELFSLWTDTSQNDIGVMLIELFALMGDSLSYYQDRIVSESFLSTASERPSVLKLASLIGYTPSTAAGATVDVTFTLSSNPAGVTLPKGTLVGTTATATEVQKVYSLDADEVITAGNLTGIGQCTHGRTYTETFTGTGAPSQNLRLAQGPVLSGKIDVEVAAVTWAEVTNLADKNETDQVYQVQYQEDGSANIQFGDGVHGFNPANAAAIVVDYVAGGGVGGRVAAAKVNVYLGSAPLVASVTNVTASSGGSEREGLGSIKVNAPASLKTVGRAVTAADFEVLTNAVSGVIQSKAVEYGGFVRVSIVPTGGGTPSGGLKTSVTNELEMKRMVGQHVVVEDPVYVLIDLTVTVVGVRGYKSSVLATRVATVIDGFLDPNVATDGLYLQGYGVDVYLSEIYELINAIDGVDRCQISVLKKSTDSATVGDVNIKDIEIRSKGTVSVSIVEGSTTAQYHDQVRRVKKSNIV